MELAADIISWPLLMAGAIFSIIGGIGMIRMPDLFSRMHAAGMVDTIGMALIAIGLMFQAGASLVTVKLIIIVLFVVFTSPTSTHALAKAAQHGAVRPLVDRSATKDRDKPKNKKGVEHKKAERTDVKLEEPKKADAAEAKSEQPKKADTSETKKEVPKKAVATEAKGDLAKKTDAPEAKKAPPKKEEESS